MQSWVEAVKAAIIRHVSATGSLDFTRKGLEQAELAAIVADTGTTGITPGQTLGRELQQLRDAGFVAFLEPGHYRWLGSVPDADLVVPSKAVFLLRSTSLSEDPDRAFAVPSASLHLARQAVGQWIIYQRQQGYFAAARVAEVDANSARMDRGTYLEFGRTVPLQHDGLIVEQGLVDASGALNLALAGQAVRMISQDDFDRIIDLALAGDDLLPRSDSDGEAATLPRVAEEASPWDGPVDRATMLVSRKVRNRQFRQRVLDAYGARCALTGMRLINGGGRAETEAAHIMSVEAGGPDAVNNGIALSGTIHWMFDRGLISLGDTGEILLSRAINDRDGIERLIYRDGRARFPVSAADRPHPQYLPWHRTECFHH